MNRAVNLWSKNYILGCLKHLRVVTKFSKKIENVAYGRKVCNDVALAVHLAWRLSTVCFKAPVRLRTFYRMDQ